MNKTTNGDYPPEESFWLDWVGTQMRPDPEESIRRYLDDYEKSVRSPSVSKWLRNRVKDDFNDSFKNHLDNDSFNLARLPSVSKIFFTNKNKLREVVRWPGKYYCQNPIHHAYGKVVLASRSIETFSSYKKEFNLDRELVIKSIVTHDLAEAFTRKNILYDKKTVQSDIEEYEKFEQYVKSFDFGCLDKKDLEKIKRIYLLQFCHQNTENFPQSAQDSIGYLKCYKQQEIIFFQFLKLYEHLFFATFCYVFSGKNILIAEVSRKHLQPIKDLVEQNKFLSYFWTDSIDKYFSKFI